MQLKHLSCPKICKLFPTVPFPGVVSLPTPGTLLIPLAVTPPTEWFKHFPGLLWATVSPSVCTIIFICHAYLIRRARKLLQGWGIVMCVCFSSGACVWTSLVGMSCWWDQRETASVHTWAHPLLHSWSLILTQPNYGTGSPGGCRVALCLPVTCLNHLRASIFVH